MSVVTGTKWGLFSIIQGIANGNNNNDPIWYVCKYISFLYIYVIGIVHI